MSSTRQPAGVFTRKMVSFQVVALVDLSSCSSLTEQRPFVLSPVHVPTSTDVAPSNIEVKRSPSTRGGESLFALENRVCAASAALRSDSSAGDRYGAYFERSVADGIPSEG